MNEINQSLLDDGWRIYPDHLVPERTLFCKSFEGHAECCCNEGKRKQVEVYFSPKEQFRDHTFQERWMVSLSGELPDGEWIRMQCEGLKTFDQINIKVQSILSAWDHIFSITQSKNQDA